MKKIIFTFTAILLIAMMIAPAAFAAGERGKALIIYGYVDDAIGEGDKAIGARFESLGYAADYVAAPDSDENSWKGYDIVFIGESVTSADVATKLTMADALVIVGEPGLYDEMQIGNYDTLYDSESYTGSYKVVNDLIGCGLTTFKGFTTDDVIPGFLLDYAEGVQIIAENENGSPAVTMVAPGGKLLDGSSAANYRFSIFCRRQDSLNFSDDAWKLFDAIIDFVYPIPVIEEVAVPAAEESPAPVAAETVAPAAVAVSAPQTADMTVITALMALISAAGVVTLKKRK
jgi:hypothetical protein